MITLINCEYDGIIFIKQEGSIVDESTSIILENICNKEGITMINLNFNESINKINIDNNINMFFDMINTNKIKENY